jgi:transposase InsO family protein
VAYYKSLGVTIQRLLTEQRWGISFQRLRQGLRRVEDQTWLYSTYRPQTNGMAERFIQSALRGWAYGFVYQNSHQRTHQLDAWIHHYNWHRPHQGIGGVAPMTRLKTSCNNLLTLHIWSTFLYLTRTEKKHTGK